MNRFRQWREEQGLTLSELAKRAMMPYMTLWCYETGKRKPDRNGEKKILELTDGQVTYEDIEAYYNEVHNDKAA